MPCDQPRSSIPALGASLDLVYEIADEPNQAPSLGEIDLRNGAFDPLPSAARVACAGNTVVALIPADERVADCPGHRVTSFVHLGYHVLQLP